MKNYITPQGAQRLKDELKKLLYQERPELVRVISWAASNGDRSENGDYIYGKRRLREIDRRIRFLTQKLENFEIVQPYKDHPGRVLFGACVTVSDEEGREQSYRIVGQEEIDLARGWVSWVSPIAKALLNSKVGDVVQFQTQKGERELEILEISYDENDSASEGGK